MRCNICDDTSYGVRVKKSCLRFNNCKSIYPSFRKGKQNVPQKRFRLQYVPDCRKGIDDWEATLFEKCETRKHLKERETFM